MLSTLARVIDRAPRVWLAGWLLVTVGCYLLAAGVVGPGLFDRLESGPPTTPSQSQDGLDRLQEENPDGPVVSLLATGLDPADPQVAALVAGFRPSLASAPHVVAVHDPFLDPQDPRSAVLADPDQDAFAVLVTLDPGLGTHDARQAVPVIAEDLAVLARDLRQGRPGAEVSIGSTSQFVDSVTAQAEEDLRTGESVALPFSLLVMILVFGGFLAAGMPIVGALASVGGGLAALLGWAHVLDLDPTVVNVVTVLGLGLCIDYGLILVSRFREEVVRAADPGATRLTAAQRRLALERTMGSAGRTIVFSGFTVAIATAGLLLFQAPLLRSVAAGGVSTVLVAMATALTLVPALLVVTAERYLRPGVLTRLPGMATLVNALGDVHAEEGSFRRLAVGVQRRPRTVLVAVTALLLLLASPLLGIEIRSSYNEMLPRDHPQRVHTERIEDTFPSLSPAPIQVVFEGSDPQTLQAAARWSAQAAPLAGVRAVDPPTPVGQVTLVGLRLEGEDTGGPQAKATVQEVRAHAPDGEHWVTGQAALLVDFIDATWATTPWVVLVIAVTTFVLLFLMTGSVLIPVKALILNLLSLGATMGILVWVFQDGHGARLLGFESAHGIETFIPPLVLALGFGLSMDYEVFLISRIKEGHDRGMAPDEAVAWGLQKSGRIITSAALIMIIVFLGFVTGQMLAIKQAGFALAVAVALDATVVRMLLVPAAMTLLGRRAWWAPRPLRRLHARVGLRH